MSIVKVAEETGFLLNDVANASLNQWDIPRAMRHCFRTYFILHWEGAYLRQQIIRGSGTITKDNIKYNIVYGKGLVPTKIIAGEQFRLSFRKPIQGYHLPGIVIIRPLLNLGEGA